jgi:HEAT repeat protein
MNLRICLLLAALVAATSLPAASPKPKRATDKVTPLVTQTADQLTAVLQSTTDRKARIDACRGLAVVGNEKSIPALLPLLADPEMSHMARYALETMPGSKVDSALRDQLGKLKGLQLVGVIGSIGVRKDAKAVKPLSSLLADSDPQVANTAAGALGSIGNSDSLKVLLAALSGKSGTAQLVVADGCLRAAAALGAKGQTRQTRAAYDQLRSMPGLPAQVRAAATRGAILAAGKDTKILRESLQGADWQFIAATRAALELAGPDAASALLDALPKLPDDKKTVVIQTLGAIRAPTAIQPLSTLARGNDPLRVAAIKSIAQIGTAEVIPVLLELCGSDNSEVSQTSRAAFAGLTLPAADEAVAKLIRRGTTPERLLGIELAARRRMTSMLPELFDLAAASDASLKAAALRRIGELGGVAQVPEITSLILKTSNPADLEAISAALTRICTQAEKSPKLTSEVVGAFNKALPAQKVALLPAVQAVGGNAALAAVRSALADSNSDLNKAACEALADWPDMAAAPELLRLATSAPEASQRAAAFRGYVRLVRESDLAPDARLKLLKEAAAVDAGTAGQKLVLSGLGDISSAASLKLVAEKLDDPALSEEACAAAVRIAEKLGESAKAEAKPIIEKVAKTAKSASVLEKANKLLQ